MHHAVSNMLHGMAVPAVHDTTHDSMCLICHCISMRLCIMVWTCHRWHMGTSCSMKHKIEQAAHEKYRVTSSVACGTQNARGIVSHLRLPGCMAASTTRSATWRAWFADRHRLGNESAAPRCASCLRIAQACHLYACRL